MKTTVMAALLLLTSSVAGKAQCDTCKPKPIYKVTKLSLTEVSISCTNGADPTGKKLGDILVISCGN
jgi:hypothetical protein